MPDSGHADGTRTDLRVGSEYQGDAFKARPRHLLYLECGRCHVRLAELEVCRDMAGEASDGLLKGFLACEDASETCQDHERAREAFMALRDVMLS